MLIYYSSSGVHNKVKLDLSVSIFALYDREWGCMGCLLVVVPLQGGGRTLHRVAELHWSTCNTQL